MQHWIVVRGAAASLFQSHVTTDHEVLRNVRHACGGALRCSLRDGTQAGSCGQICCRHLCAVQRYVCNVSPSAV